MYETADNNCWDDAEKMAFLAYELYENGQMNLALLQLEEAIGVNPSNSAWHFNSGLTLDALDRFDDAIKAYLEALSLGGDDPEILNSLAVDYTRIGKYDLAISTFEDVQREHPDFEPCYCNRIITYTEMEQHEKAEEIFYLAQQIDPDCPICFYNIGNSLFSRQNYERAIWCWEKTAELEPTHPQINYRIAQAHWANGEMDIAKRYFLEELRCEPGDIDVILDFGTFLLKNAEHDNAREKFNRILELDPEYAPAYFYLGEVAYDQGDNAEATKLYFKATTYDSTLPGPRYRLAQLATDANNKTQALKFLMQECALEIDESEVLMSMGRMFAELGEADHAMNCYLKIIDEDPEHAEAFYRLGQTLSKEGEHEGGLQFLEHAIGLGKDGAEMLAENAMMYLKVKQLFLAKRMVKLAKEKDATNAKVKRVDMLVKIAMVLFKIRLYLLSNIPVQNIKLFIYRRKCQIRQLVNKFI